MILINKNDYTLLLKDLKNNENLLNSFQKENERLIKLSKKQEIQENFLKTSFFNQQEELNRELNKLKNEQNNNINFIQHNKKTADILKTELELDCLIRELKEKLIISEKTIKNNEYEFQSIIEKLRFENKELISTINNLNLSLNDDNDNDSEVNNLKNENKNLKIDIKNLNDKINWYIENQKIIDDVELNLKKNNFICKLLKNELLKRNTNLKINDINKLIDNSIKKVHFDGGYYENNEKNNKNTDDDGEINIEMTDNKKNEKSFTNTINNKNNKSYSLLQQPHRSFADIKKIKFFF
jgi:hypothetical protein